LIAIVPGWIWYSPGIITRSLDDRVVDGDELGSVREGGFHLNVRDHLRHALHHLVARQDVAAASISEATVSPSRAPSMMKALISATDSG
jgi:hypothetical protein